MNFKNFEPSFQNQLKQEGKIMTLKDYRSSKLFKFSNP